MEFLEKLRNLFVVPPAETTEEPEVVDPAEFLCPTPPASPPPQMDTHWLDRFTKQEEQYRYFYQEPVYFVNLRFVYVNANSEIEKVQSEYYTMQQQNVVSREEMLGILKRCRADPETGKQYSLLSLLQYNITLHPRQVSTYVQGKVDDTSFWRTLKHFDAVTFQPTIESLNDLNELLFVLYEKTRVTPSPSRSDNDERTCSRPLTKKIIVIDTANHRKTRRKRFKAVVPHFAAATTAL